MDFGVFAGNPYQRELEQQQQQNAWQRRPAHEHQWLGHQQQWQQGHKWHVQPEQWRVGQNGKRKEQCQQYGWHNQTQEQPPQPEQWPLAESYGAEELQMISPALWTHDLKIRGPMLSQEPGIRDSQQPLKTLKQQLADFAVPGSEVSQHPQRSQEAQQAQLVKMAQLEHWQQQQPQQPQQPQQQQQRPPRTDKLGLVKIASCLERLGREDAACVLIVKGLARLGFGSLKAVRAYFQQFGSVREVLSANAPGQASAACPEARVRPVGMVYVLMSCPADARRALALGETHMVHGISISVRPFEHRKPREPDASAMLEHQFGCFKL